MFTARDFIEGPAYILRGKVPVPCKKPGAAWDRCVSTRVAHTELAHVEISTTFLGWDHRHDDTSREGFSVFIAKSLRIIGKGPLLFESAVFRRSAGVCALEMWRYSTWEEAELGHAELVARWKERTP